MESQFPRWARFLHSVHYLLWLGRGWTRGPVHFDENENLHTVVRGTKKFELFHPLDSKNLYEGRAQVTHDPAFNALSEIPPNRVRVRVRVRVRALSEIPPHAIWQVCCSHELRAAPRHLAMF